MRSPRLPAVLLSCLLTLLLLPLSASAAVPDAQDDTATVAEDSGATDIDVLANDGTDAGTNVVTGATDGAHGSVTFDDNGVAYTPDADFFGADSFTYTVSNDDGPSTATVDVTVTPVNDPPSFTPGDDVTVDEDSGPASFSNWATGFDPGPSNESAQIIHFTVAVPNAEKNLFSAQPAIGAENSANPGRLTFTPAANAHGVAHVTVTAVDNGGTPGDSTGTPQALTITITSQNDPPHRGRRQPHDRWRTPSATAVDVLAGDTDPDGDTLTITDVTQGAKGTVVITGGGTGVTYEPDANANGADTFTYTIDDGNGGTDTGTVHVTITPVNDKPDAGDDGKTLDEDSGATAIDVLGNDDDVDGNTLTIASVTQGDKGTVAITGGGTGLTYTPDPNANGADSFSYTISDGHGMSDTADVSITINAKNDPPVAPGDSATMNEDAGATPIDVLANDSDVDGDALTIVATTDGALGRRRHHRRRVGPDLPPERQLPRNGHVHVHRLRRDGVTDRDRQRDGHLGQRPSGRRRRRLRRRRGRAGHPVRAARRRHGRRRRRPDDHVGHARVQGRRRDRPRRPRHHVSAVLEPVRRGHLHLHDLGRAWRARLPARSR